MKKIAILLCALSLSFSAFAQDVTPPTEASIHTLFELTKQKNLMDGVWVQIDKMMQTTMRAQLQGHDITPSQQAIIDDMRSQMLTLFSDQLKWEKFEPKVVDIYQKTFSQNEVDGMIAFYASPAGQAVVSKLPLAMQNTMSVVQANMTELMPKLQAIEKDAQARLKADSEKNGQH